MASTRRAKPYTERLPGGGTAAIMVPLIIGGALIVGVYILWSSHERISRQLEMTRVEEEIRHDLIRAYRFLVDARPEEALAITRDVEQKATIFRAVRRTDYAELRAAVLMLQGQAEFMILCDDGAPQVEEKFTKALHLMMRASGEMWEFGMMGRARARIDQGKFQEAEEDLNVLLTGNPNYGAGYYWRAMARTELGDTEGAQADEARARALDSWPPRRNLLQDACGDAPETL